MTRRRSRRKDGVKREDVKKERKKGGGEDGEGDIMGVWAGTAPRAHC